MEDKVMLPSVFTKQFPSVFSRFFDDDIFDWSSRHYSNTNTTLPSVNIKENTDDYTVEMAAPGLKKEDFKVELDNDVLTIACEKEEQKEEQSKYSKQEFCYLSFSRSFTLPSTVKNDAIKASYKDGILSVVIPKKEEAKPLPPKTITIA